MQQECVGTDKKMVGELALHFSDPPCLDDGGCIGWYELAQRILYFPGCMFTFELVFLFKLYLAEGFEGSV